MTPDPGAPTQDDNPPRRVSSADGRSDVRAHVGLEFGSDSPVTLWRGVSVSSSPRLEVRVDPESYDDECTQICRQLQAMFNEGFNNIVTQIWARYEALERHRQHAIGQIYDEARGQRRLDDLRFRLGLMLPPGYSMGDGNK